MVIGRSDRVSTVLSADESLIDVFVDLSPAFERLRNPAMRKIMSRLVTVEQAARMAGVDADALVARLNGGSGARPTDDSVASAAAGPHRESPDAVALPEALRRLPTNAILDLDVRDDLRHGREPFSRIMAAKREVPYGGALRLRAIFEPVPLYAVMGKQGFHHHTEQIGPEDWCVWFYRPDDEEVDDDEAASRGSAADRADPGAPDDASPAAVVGEAGGEGVLVLDVRGLEPPEPMVRTLAALEDLPADGTLVQVNVRVPEFLLPRLEERGFVYEIREQTTEIVRVFITRRKPTEGGVST